MPLSRVVKEELPYNIDKRIYVFERAIQFELLRKNPMTFMWVSPVPQDILERQGLVQKKCAQNKKVYKDILIYQQGYKLSVLDKRFIDELENSKGKTLGKR
jgi:hypothetical protein